MVALSTGISGKARAKAKRSGRARRSRSRGAGCRPRKGGEKSRRVKNGSHIGGAAAGHAASSVMASLGAENTLPPSTQTTSSAIFSKSEVMWVDMRMPRDCLGHEVAQQVEHLVAGDGSKVSRGLVKHEQLRLWGARRPASASCPCRERARSPSFWGQVEAVAQRGELGGVPFAVGCRPMAPTSHTRQVSGRRRCQHDADAGFDGVHPGAAAGDGLPEQAHGARVCGDDAETALMVVVFCRRRSIR